MKQLLSIILIILPFLTWANMASPMERGTRASTPFISEHVDIIKEDMLITLDKDFRTAKYKIEYHVKANQEGINIPLLFYALEYKDNFKVWLDDKEISLQEIPADYQELQGAKLQSFDYFFKSDTQEKPPVIHLDHGSTWGQVYAEMNDLKFFETDFAIGKHIIRVEYTAAPWQYKQDWVNEYSFRYALAPAQYWKSFGGLNVTIDASNFKGEFITNLGAPTSGNLNNKAVWTFSELPKEALIITHKPIMNSSAKTLVTITPEGLSIIFALILMGLHLFIMRKWRQHNVDTKFSWVMIVGSLILPFIALLSLTFSYSFIDSTIGVDASNYHGYTILMVMFYPFVMPAYWLVMWLVDRFYARSLRAKA